MQITHSACDVIGLELDLELELELELELLEAG